MLIIASNIIENLIWFKVQTNMKIRSQEIITNNVHEKMVNNVIICKQMFNFYDIRKDLFSILIKKF